MRKYAVIAMVVFGLGFSGSAHALALYNIGGTFPAGATIQGTDYENVHVTGILGIEGIDNFFDFQEGNTYEFFYNIAYADWNSQPKALITSRSHWGILECLYAEIEFGSNDYRRITFGLEGDDGTRIYMGEDTRWRDPYAGTFFYASLHDMERPTQPVPEPSIMLLLLSGLISLGAIRKKI